MLFPQQILSRFLSGSVVGSGTASGDIDVRFRIVVQIKLRDVYHQLKKEQQI